MGAHILIVDADTNARRVTGAIVARALPDVSLAIMPTFESAWLSLEECPPSALIIDPSQHPLDSDRLIQHVKAAQPPAHVIVVASTPTPALRRRMLNLGVDTYLEKPVLLPHFTQHLHAIFHNISHPEQ